MSDSHDSDSDTEHEAGESDSEEPFEVAEVGEDAGIVGNNSAG